jgi:hypothetical protein
MSFQGASELTDGKKAVDGKKTLLLLATAPVSGEGVVPREIDAFLDELRKSDVLKRDFASVELTTMRQASSPRMQGQESQSEASFTIVCLPKAKGRAKPAEK